MKIKIESDVFDISNRIKQIDRDYCIFFNTESEKFELHNLSQSDTYCLSVPYPHLDERTLNLTRETNSANIEIILEKIETENQILKNAEIRSVMNDLNYQLEQLIREKE